MGHRRRPALLQGQAGLGAIKRLDLAFLVQAQHQRLVRRVQVKADDVAHFLGEPRIVREFEGPHEMRLQAGLRPDALHAPVRDADRLGHRSRAPVRAVWRPLLCRLGQHRKLLGRERLLAPRPRLVAHDTGLQVARLPAPHGGLGLAGAPHDRHRAEPVDRRQNNLGAPGHLARLGIVC